MLILFIIIDCCFVGGCALSIMNPGTPALGYLFAAGLAACVLAFVRERFCE